MFNLKIKGELRQMGYTDHFIDIVGYIDFDDSVIKEKNYDKLYRIYHKKYSDEKLEQVIKQKMFQLGFDI